MKKRFFSLLLALFVFVSAVTIPYYETKAFDIPTAFWGTLEASRAFWTALNAGGGVRGGGVSLSKFELSSRQDISDFQTQILIGYEAFLYYKNKIKIALENPSLSDSEIQNQAQTQATNQKKNFEDNAIKVNNSTKNITKTDYGYWREYCDSIDYIARNGLQTPVATSKCKVYVANGLSINNTLGGISAENTFEYNGHTYPLRGRIDGIWTNLHGDASNYIVPYCVCMTQAISVGNPAVTKYNYRLYAYGIDVRGNLGKFQYATTDYYGPYDTISELISMIQLIVDDSNLPIFVVDRSQYDSFQNNLISNINLLQLDNNISTDETYQYKIAIKEALDNTIVGQSIKEGAESGSEAIISANSVPVKRTSIKVGEETATGVIGWDIPDARTLEGAIAIPQQQQEVVEGMGVISVPESIVIGGTAENVIEWPKAEDISIPKAGDESVSMTIDEVLSVQGGEYYPSQIDLTEFFPFCIPFDIAYCVQKFHVVGEAPIIHLPIVYPEAMQSTLGESYDVVIDFNDFVVLRNIIRYFLLLGFIIGLMLLTRNLIRG